MKLRIPVRCVLYLALGISVLSMIQPLAAFQNPDSAWQARGNGSAIITGCAEGASAGMELLDAGGNAVDAAVACMLVQSVIESQLFCFGSEVPMIVFDAKRNSVEVVAGLGASPALASQEWFNTHRKGVIQGRGDIANCIVPGFLDACVTALDRYGTKTFAECAGPMLVVLRKRAGATPEQVPEMAGRRSRVEDPERWIAHHRNFLRLIERLIEAEATCPDDRRGGLLQVSERFYRGDIAREIDAWSRENGGLLRYSDLARHHTRIEQPLRAEFAGHTVCKCGVWTQGPCLLQTLRLLEMLGVSGMKHNSADYVHRVVETMKLCLADRDAYFADPEYTEVPVKQLLSDEYLALRAELLQSGQASREQQPGNPWAMQALLGTAPQDHKVTSGRSNDTSSCIVADAEGNVVSATPSGWGGVIAGDTGIEMGSRMIGLTCWAGHPSELVPGKRPRITLTPTLVLRDGKPVFAVSVAGGDQQDQASLQVVLNHLAFGLPPDQAVQAFRFGTDHHINWFGHLPFQPASLTLPGAFGGDVLEALRERGHEIREGRPSATAVCMSMDPASGHKHAAGDRGRFALAK